MYDKDTSKIPGINVVLSCNNGKNNESNDNNALIMNWLRLYQELQTLLSF